MTHSLAEKKLGDESDTPAPTTTPVLEKNAVLEKKDGQPPSTPIHALGQPGLVFGPDMKKPAKSGSDDAMELAGSHPTPARRGGPMSKSLYFEWTTNEIFGYPTAVKDAMAMYADACSDVRTARSIMLATLPESIQAGFEATVSHVETVLGLLASGPIAVANREDEIRLLARTHALLDVTIQAAIRIREEHLAEQERIAEQERVAREAAAVEAAEQLRLLEEEAEREREAEAARQLEQQKQREIAEKARLLLEAEQKRAREEAEAAAKAEAEAKAKLEAEQEAERQRVLAEQQREAEERRRVAEAEAEAERLTAEAEAAERARIAEAELAAQQRRALFGDNQAAFDAAMAAGNRVAQLGFASEMAVLSSARDKAAGLAGKTKSKARKGTRKQGVSTLAAAETTAQPPHEVEFAKGEAKAEQTRESVANARVGEYGRIASTQAGKTLEATAPTELAWAISASDGKTGVADKLVQLCAQGKAGVSVAHQIADSADPGEAARLSATLLAMGQDPDSVGKSAVLLTDMSASTQKWVLALLRLDKAATVSRAKSYLDGFEGGKLALAAAAVMGLSHETEELVKSATESKSTLAALNWLLAVPGPARTALRLAIVNKNLQIDLVQAIVVPHSAAFTLAGVIEVIASAPSSLAQMPDLFVKAAGKPAQMVTIWLRIGGAESQNRFVIAAMEAEAQLMAAQANIVAWDKADKFYRGSSAHRAHNLKANARTGFLTLTVMSGTFALHAHWEVVGDMSLTSLHIQIGEDEDATNGTELNDIESVFPLLVGAAIDTLNGHNPTGGAIKRPKRKS